MTRVLVVLACGLALAAAQPAADPAALRERDELAAKAERHLADGKPAEAVAAARLALEKTRAARAAGHADEADGLALLARAREAAGDFAAAVADRDAAVMLRVKLHGEADWRAADAKRWAEYARLRQGLPPEKQKQLAAADVKLAVAELASRAGKVADIAAPAGEALALLTAALPADHWRVADGYHAVGRAENKGPEPCETANRAALAIRLKALGPDHPDTGRSRMNLGNALDGGGHPDKAIPEFREAARIFGAVYGDAHALTFFSNGRLYRAQFDTGRYRDAAETISTVVRVAENTYGPGSIQHGQALMFHGAMLARVGRTAEGRVLLRRAVEMHRAARPPRHAEAAEALSHLSNTYSPDFRPLDGDLVTSTATARALAVEAVVEVRKAADVPPPVLTLLLKQAGLAVVGHASALGTAHAPEAERQAAFAAAREYFDAARELDLKARPPNVESATDSLIWLGLANRGAGDGAGARRALREAITLSARAGPAGPVLEARARAELGWEAKLEGDYATAERELTRAVDLFRKAGPAEHERLSGALSNRGVVRYRGGRFVEARTDMAEAVDLESRLPRPGWSESRELMLGLLGRFEYELGDLRAGFRHQEESLAASRKINPKQHRNFGEGHFYLALTYREAGDRRVARAHLDLAREAMRADQPGLPAVADACCDLVLALLALDAGDVAAARKLSDGAPHYRDPALATHDYYLMAHSIRATALRRAGDLPAARAAAEEGLAGVAKIKRDDAPVAALATDLGAILSEQGDHAAARRRLAAAAARLADLLPPDHRLAAHNLHAQARNEARAGDAAATRGFYDRAVDGYLRTADRIAPAQSESAQLARAADLEALALEYAHVAGPDAYPRLLRVKGATAVRQRLLRAAADPADPEVRRLAADLAAVNFRLSSAAFLPAGPAGRADDKGAGTIPTGPKVTEQLLAERDRLERLLADRNPAYKQAVSRPAPTPAAARAALPPGAALVDFYHAADPKDVKADAVTPDLPRRLVAFVTRPDRDAATRIDLGDAAPVAAAVDRWRGRYAGKDPDPKVTGDPAADLRRLVWEPVAKELGGARLVLVAPDGPLAALPFAALPGEKAGTYLIEDGYTFVTVPVPQLLPPPAARPAPAADSLLLVGDVDFGPPAGGRAYEPLRGSEFEVLSIAQRFRREFPGKKVDVLDRAGATKAAFVAAAPGRRYVHLATHGFFADEDVRSALDPAARGGRGGLLAGPPDGLHPGLLSGVVFAGVNADPKGGFLSALEVGDLDLSGVELAVLSACNTGRGRVAGGEGVLGLQRALQVAGVRTTVASLWSVPDVRTAELMAAFYQHLWEKKLPPAAALREAQLALLRAARARNVGGTAAGLARPHEWAGFVLAGDGR